MCCGILLVLHVNINSSVCYIMVIEFLLIFCCRQQKEREEGGKVLESLGKLFDSCRFSVLLCPRGTVL